jgi:hypothetical protein
VGQTFLVGAVYKHNSGADWRQIRGERWMRTAVRSMPIGSYYGRLLEALPEAFHDALANWTHAVVLAIRRSGYAGSWWAACRT